MNGISSSDNPNILILGIGNILMSDEGVGIKVIEKLEQDYSLPPNITLLDGGTAGYTLLDIMKDYEKIIIIDAVLGGKEPGTIYRLTANDIMTKPELKLSGHQIDLSEVVALAQKLRELPELLLFGVEPASMDYSTEIGPEVSGVMDRLIETILDELSSAPTFKEKKI